jgi:hypothetical protein
VLVAFAATGLMSGSRLGNVRSVPPPAIAFTAPARNEDEQRRAELQAGFVMADGNLSAYWLKSAETSERAAARFACVVGVVAHKAKAVSYNKDPCES